MNWNRLRNPFLYFLGLAAIWTVWSFNAGKAGFLFDYSIVINGVQALKSGLVPIRDFPCSLQSLTLLLCRAADAVFGPRYYSLALANLVLAAGFYSGLIFLLRSTLGFACATVLGVVLCVAGPLQHGVLWYNSLALALLSLLCITVSRLQPGTFQPARQLPPVLLLATLLGMTKMNFHLLGIGFTGLMLARVFVVRYGLGRGLSRLAVCGGVMLLAGPMVECLIDHVTPAAWFDNVIRTPGQRAAVFDGFMQVRFWFGRYRVDYATGFGGEVFWICALFAGAVYVIWRNGGAAEPQSGRAGLKTMVRPVLLAGSTLLITGALIISNSEIQILAEAFFLVGWICLYLNCPQWHQPSARAIWLAVAVTLAVYLGGAGYYSAARHIRLRLGPDSQARLEAPLEPAGVSNPWLASYFRGVQFFPETAAQMRELAGMMKTHGVDPRHAKVFWAPEFEFMNRVLDTSGPPGVPLWFHHGVSFKTSDGMVIRDIIARRQFDWFVGGKKWLAGLPVPVIEYLKADYEWREGTDVILGRLKTHPLSNP